MDKHTTRLRRGTQNPGAYCGLENGKIMCVPQQ